MEKGEEMLEAMETKHRGFREEVASHGQRYKEEKA